MHNNRTGESTLENRDFVGKSALIVGGTSGIGKAVARLLLERGAASVIVAGRNVEKLHAAESELSAFGRVVGREVDITNQTELARVLGESGNQLDGVDLLVNAAGVFLPKPFLEHTMEDYDRYLEFEQGNLFHNANRRTRNGGSRRWIYRERRIDVGAAGYRGNTLLGVFDGKGGIACSNSAPCPGAGPRSHQGECGFSCGGRDTDLRSIHSKGSGSRSPTGLQWISPDWTDRKA